jgi:hypothetical protein
MNLWFKDPKTGEYSVTLTFFVLGFIVALLKLLFAGMVIMSFKFGEFTGGEFATVVGALGAIYWARKNTDSKE